MGFLSDIAIHAHTQLPSRAREALWARGVSDEQIDAFKIGWLPGQLPVVDASGEFRTWWVGHQWRLANTFVFPLTNSLGEINGLQFRSMDEKKRGYLDYIGSKEEPVFFGLAQAMPSVWTSEEVWLVEGVFDLCPLQRHVANVVSTLHAGVSKQLWRLLRRLVRRINLAYDMDGTGMKVSYDIVREMGRHFQIKVVRFPKIPFRGGFAKDPNDYWSIWGDAHLGSFLKAQ
jgi:DNA primase